MQLANMQLWMSSYECGGSTDANMCVQQMVRGQLTTLERATASVLIVLDVHSRDVVASMLKNGISSEEDFEWLSQLRYYWTHATGGPECDISETVMVHMIHAKQIYGCVTIKPPSD